mmetsp:Transcript_2799/g.5407  ORF Transcript_2799/g.5407 Transcript_2799/m.5407 type:complete len:194 (+) Transcript_2799:249-830(+)
MIARMLAQYDAALRAWPLVTKSLSAGMVTMAGDALAQKVMEKREKLDVVRNARFLLIGTVLTGPSLHFWYGGLAKMLPGVSVASIAGRVLLDQLVFTPIFFAVFFPLLSYLEGRSVLQMKAELQQIWAPTLVRNWGFWTPVQAINFRFIPGRYQVLWSNSASVFWNCYLSTANQAAKVKADADAQSNKLLKPV